MYDVTSRESYQHVEHWLKEVMSNVSEIAKIAITVIGNKSDLESKRQVTYEEGSKIAAKYNASFLETSAKADVNVKEAYQLTAENMYELFSEEQDKKNNIQLSNIPALIYRSSS